LSAGISRLKGGCGYQIEWGSQSWLPPALQPALEFVHSLVKPEVGQTIGFYRLSLRAFGPQKFMKN
jgi:hypothetical protein